MSLQIHDTLVQRALAVLRIVTAYLLIQHGTAKHFAYFVGHAPRGNVLSPMLNGGESAVLFCFVFLFMAAAGGGRWSLDARRAPARHRGLVGAAR